MTSENISEFDMKAGLDAARRNQEMDPLSDWERVRCMFIQAVLAGVEIFKHEGKLMACESAEGVEAMLIALQMPTIREARRNYAEGGPRVLDLSDLK